MMLVMLVGGVGHSLHNNHGWHVGDDHDGDAGDADSDVGDVGWRGWPQFAHGQPLPAQKLGMGADTDFDGFGRFDESPARSDDDILL